MLNWWYILGFKVVKLSYKNYLCGADSRSATHIHSWTSNYITTPPCAQPDKSCPQIRTVFISDTLSLSLPVDVTVKYKTFFNLTKKSDGQTYLQPLDYELVLDPKKFVGNFGNLFNGNKLLGETHGIQSVNTAVSTADCSLTNSKMASFTTVKGGWH